MERIFQHFEGEVEAFKQSEFSSVKSLVEISTSDIILVWLYDKCTSLWYRIFIDGAYCGIDAYKNDESELDLDDEVKYIDITNWFNGKVLKSAAVTFENKQKRHIVLALDFNEALCEFVCKSEDGDCELQYA